MTTTTKPDYVYVTYIATTAEKVWQALTDPAIAREYWGGAKGPTRMNVSDWKVGSRWEHVRADDSHAVDIVGKVLESDPPKHLLMTWARPAEEADTAKHSRVRFDIEPVEAGLIKLTVAHEDVAKDPKMLEGISGGWPLVLSNLKTLLETGRALPRAPAAS
ncbi:MAG: SRPBCC family protein [Gemmatimonadales bacterium]